MTKLCKVADMAKEHRFDCSKAKPNRLASRMKDEESIVVINLNHTRTKSRMKSPVRISRDFVYLFPNLAQDRIYIVQHIVIPKPQYSIS
jgi:hypothetical protein